MYFSIYKGFDIEEYIFTSKKSTFCITLIEYRYSGIIIVLYIDKENRV